MDDRTITAKDPKPTPERIQQLAQRVLIGDIVLPEFQRPFVWKRKQILELVDSIYRNYPIGSMLVWESHQKLASKRSIADLDVMTRREQYPVNYLLDGQQRLSTLCGVLHWKPGDPRSVWNVVFDLKNERFHHVDHADDELPVHQIPLRRLSDPAQYFRSITTLSGESFLARADLLFNRFKDYQVPLVTLGDMSINDVAPVFERINSTGTRLTIYDLMRAATWAPEFDLGRTIEDIQSALEPKSFNGLDEKTLLRALAAASGGDFSSSSIDALRDLSPGNLLEITEAMKKAAKCAADFLATEIGAPRSESLPYANQFAILCEIFRALPNPTGLQLAEIKRWFWLTTLSNYFSGWDSGQMASDAKLVRRFAIGEIAKLDVAAVVTSERLWMIKPFRSNSAASKMLALMLAFRKPLDLLNGQRIDVDKSLHWSNDKEYHHFFPRAYLARRGFKSDKANVIGNIVLLTSKSNIKIRDSAPSEYLAEVIKEQGRAELLARLETNLVPDAALEAALADDYEAFLQVRSEHLHQIAQGLAGASPAGTVSAEEVDDSADDSTD